VYGLGGDCGELGEGGEVAADGERDWRGEVGGESGGSMG